MKRWFFVVLFVLSACQFSPPKQKAFQVNIQDEPSSLDPRKARALAALNVIRHLFEGLTRINKEEKAEAALAEKIVISPDQKTYTFHLRPSWWSNGDPVTAEDFAYAWKKVLDPSFDAPNAFQLYVIKNGKAAKEGKVSLEDVGITVLSPSCLQVDLEQPIPYFLELTAFPIFFPINQRVDKASSKWGHDVSLLVGNGPFLIKKWEHHSLIILQKNTGYWDAKNVLLPEVRMVMVNAETALKMFEKKELDWAGSPFSTIPLDAIKELKNKQLLKEKPLSGTYFYSVNTTKPFLQDPLIRKVLALTINRKDIVEHLTYGTQKAATAFVPNFLEQSYFNDGDRERAQEIFEEILNRQGISKKEFPILTLSYPASDRNHLIAQAVQQQWLDILGIQLNLEALEPKVLFQKLIKRDYELAAGSWLADFKDPINFLEVFEYKTTGTNNTGWEHPDYISLLERARQTKDKQERTELLGQVQRLLMQEMPIIPIFHYTMLYVTNDRVKDIVLSSIGNLDLKWAHLDNPRQ